MKIKVSEATGVVLDWMVARALGKRPSLFIFRRTGKLAEEHNYSTNPAQAWPIIEREKIDTAFTEDGWYANMYNRMLDNTEGYAGDTFRCGGEGPTTLIAAMRCYVVSKLGEEVDVPEELTQ